jgi:hypothetical protein
MLSATSCIHYYYAPNSNNVPLFKEKNEARIQASYSTVGLRADGSDVIDGFEIQSAYAVGNHAAVQLNFLHAGDKESGYGSGNGNYVEAAGGYFKPLLDKQWIFETYAGIGIGGVNSEYTYPATGNAATSITKFFIQPSIGYTSDYFSTAFSSKFSLVDFGVRSSSLTKENNADDYDYIESFKKGKSYFWWEPGVMFRAGFKNVQAISQITCSVHGNDQPFCYLNYSLGIVVLIKGKAK